MRGGCAEIGQKLGRGLQSGIKAGRVGAVGRLGIGSGGGWSLRGGGRIGRKLIGRLCARNSDATALAFTGEGVSVSLAVFAVESQSEFVGCVARRWKRLPLVELRRYWPDRCLRSMDRPAALWESRRSARLMMPGSIWRSPACRWACWGLSARRLWRKWSARR